MTFTEQDVLTAMREVVAEKGEDYLYPKTERYRVGEILPDGTEVQTNNLCKYANNGKPSCIVGHVINRLDPEAFEQLATHEQEHGPEAATGLVGYGYLPSGWADFNAQQAMVTAQIVQDNGGTWGEALAKAEG